MIILFDGFPVLSVESLLIIHETGYIFSVVVASAKCCLKMSSVWISRIGSCAWLCYCHSALPEAIWRPTNCREWQTIKTTTHLGLISFMAIFIHHVIRLISRTCLVINICRNFIGLIFGNNSL